MQFVKADIPHQQITLSSGSRRSFYCRMKTTEDDCEGCGLHNIESDNKRLKGGRYHY